MVRELTGAKLNRPHVVNAVDSLVAEGRAVAEDRLYRMVREYGLPDPVWNINLHLQGSHLGGLRLLARPGRGGETGHPALPAGPHQEERRPGGPCTRGFPPEGRVVQGARPQA
ncbi:hypothetical protein SHIRM173S_12885 [Streptomyces hirsutus]